ncbi:MAG: hypothetical protein WCT46_03615 [Candidatus Gracilibacteria bacterium]
MSLISSSGNSGIRLNDCLILSLVDDIDIGSAIFAAWVCILFKIAAKRFFALGVFGRTVETLIDSVVGSDCTLSSISMQFGFRSISPPSVKLVLYGPSAGIFLSIATSVKILTWSETSAGFRSPLKFPHLQNPHPIWQPIGGEISLVYPVLFPPLGYKEHMIGFGCCILFDCSNTSITGSSVTRSLSLMSVISKCSEVIFVGMFFEN